MIILPYYTLLWHTCLNYSRKSKHFIFRNLHNWLNLEGLISDLKSGTYMTYFFCSNFTYLSFGILRTSTKNFLALSRKLWIFLLCLTLASHYPERKTEKWLAKVRHKKKIHNFWDKVTKFFFASWQYPKTQAHQIWWSN